MFALDCSRTSLKFAFLALSGFARLNYWTKFVNQIVRLENSVHQFMPWVSPNESSDCNQTLRMSRKQVARSSKLKAFQSKLLDPQSFEPHPLDPQKGKAANLSDQILIFSKTPLSLWPWRAFQQCVFSGVRRIAQSGMKNWFLLQNIGIKYK